MPIPLRFCIRGKKGPRYYPYTNVKAVFYDEVTQLNRV